MSAIIQIKDLRKVYRMGSERVVALDNISIDIHKGECCCILGTSGSGKSTLLNMIAGLEKPTKGLINIKGNRIDTMNEKKVTKFRQKHVALSFNLIIYCPI